MTVDLGVTYDQLNRAMSINFVGLATGCIFFIPFAKKYGRRPVYIVSTALMLATAFWTSRIHSLTELYICNLLQGLAGATNESIAEITVSRALRRVVRPCTKCCTDCGPFLRAPPRHNEWTIHELCDGWGMVSIQFIHLRRHNR